MPADTPRPESGDKLIPRVGISETARPAKDPGRGFRLLQEVREEQSTDALAKGKTNWLKRRKDGPDTGLSELLAFDQPRPPKREQEKRPRAATIAACVLIALAFLAILDAALRRRLATLSPVSRTIGAEALQANDLAGAMDARLQAVREVADHYFSATNLEGQLEYVREAARVRPLMEGRGAHASFHPPGKPVRIGVGEAYLMEDTERDAEFFMTRAEMEDFSQRLIAFERIGDGSWRLDWESFVAYSSLSWEEFQRHRPAESERFRVILSASDYFNYEFSDSEEFTAFKLSDYPETVVLHGYVPRGSGLEKKLQALLNHAQICYVMVDLRFPDNAASDHQVEIVDLVAPTWIPGLEKASTAAYRMMLPP